MSSHKITFLSINATPNASTQSPLLVKLAGNKHTFIFCIASYDNTMLVIFRSYYDPKACTGKFKAKTYFL